MSVTIQEDMMAAALAMPRKQGDAFLVALLRYGFLNEEPSGKPAWYPTFITCKDRVDLSVKRSNTGAGRKSKQQAQPESNPDFDSESNAVLDCNQNAEGAEINETDIRDEMSRDEERGDEVSSADSKSNAQISQIIAYLNESAGTHYKPSTPKTRSLISARIREGFGLDDFKAVIAKKCAEWRGTDMEKYLRPETLFGTKFEGYLNQSTGQQRGGGYIADYD